MSPCPLDEQDIMDVKQNGIGGVINLQTNQQMRARGINWPNIVSIYKSFGIKNVLHHPINDMDSDYRQKMFTCSRRINDMISQGQKVLIHDNSGITRAPT